MEVQKQLITARTQRGEFQAPEMTFVLVENWDEKEDGKYDASKVVEAEVQGATRRGIWKMIGKQGHFKYIQSEGVEMRDETLEENGTGKLTEMAIDAKKQVLLSNITTARENREENAVQAPQLDLTQLLSMLGNGSGERDSGPEAEPGLDGSEDEENEDPSNHDEEESAEEMEADRLDLFSFAGKSKAAAKAKAAPQAKAKTQPQQNPRPQASNRRQGEDGGKGHRWTSATASAASGQKLNRESGIRERNEARRRQAAEGLTAPKGRKGDAKEHGKATFTASGQDAEVTFKLDGRSERAKISARDKGSELRKKARSDPVCRVSRQSHCLLR